MKVLDQNPGTKQDKERQLGAYRIAYGILNILALLTLLSGAVMLPGYLSQPTKELFIQGNEIIPSAELAQALALGSEESWFSLDSFHLSQRLLNLPWVAQAHVKKTAGLGLEVVIEEQNPIAYLRQGNSLFLLSQKGVTLPIPASPKAWDLPVLVLPSEVKLQEGMKTRYFSLDQALNLMEILKSFPPLPLAGISEIRLLDPLDLQLVTSDRGILIHLGDGNWERKLDFFKRALPEISKRATQIEQIDLRNFQGPTLKLKGR